MAANEVPGAALAPSQWQMVQDPGKSLVPAQALWLSGYFAGLGQGFPAGQPAASPATGARRLTILYGRETGNAAEFACALETTVRDRGMAETIDRSRDISQALDQLSTDERMKDASAYLRGTIAAGLLDRMLVALGLSKEPVTIRMSACPNGCSRPYMAEIGLTGRAPGKYNLCLGGGFHGDRRNRIIRENVREVTEGYLFND